MKKSAVTPVLSIIIFLLVIGNGYFYNEYKTHELEEKRVFENAVSNLEGDFVSLEYYFGRILEGEETEEELTLDLIKVIERSRMISIRLSTLNENYYSINSECISLMDYYYDAFYGITYDYLTNQISIEELIENIQTLNTDMVSLRDFIASTKIQSMDKSEFEELILPKVTYEQVLERMKLHY